MDEEVMAGSYNHVVNHNSDSPDDPDLPEDYLKSYSQPTGSLLHPRPLLGMLEASGSGDVYEAIEEMYGMIWYLAKNLAEASNAYAGFDAGGPDNPKTFVEHARLNYKEGLTLSPTPRFK